MWPNPRFPPQFVQFMLFFKKTLEIYLVFRSQLQTIINTYNLPLLDLINWLYHERLKNKNISMHISMIFNIAACSKQFQIFWKVADCAFHSKSCSKAVLDVCKLEFRYKETPPLPLLLRFS